MTNNPLIALFHLFLDEYKKEPRSPEQITQFYFEMSQGTFNYLYKLSDNTSLENLKMYVTSGGNSILENKITLGCLHWDTYYVPLVLTEGLPKGKAILRKRTTKL